MNNKLLFYSMLIRAAICDTFANCPRKEVIGQYE